MLKTFIKEIFNIDYFIWKLRVFIFVKLKNAFWVLFEGLKYALFTLPLAKNRTNATQVNF